MGSSSSPCCTPFDSRCPTPLTFRHVTQEKLKNSASHHDIIIQKKFLSQKNANIYFFKIPWNLCRKTQTCVFCLCGPTQTENTEICVRFWVCQKLVGGQFTGDASQFVATQQICVWKNPWKKNKDWISGVTHTCEGQNNQESSLRQPPMQSSPQLYPQITEAWARSSHLWCGKVSLLEGQVLLASQQCACHGQSLFWWLSSHPSSLWEGQCANVHMMHQVSQLSSNKRVLEEFGAVQNCWWPGQVHVCAQWKIIPGKKLLDDPTMLSPELIPPESGLHQP